MSTHQFESAGELSLGLKQVGVSHSLVVSAERAQNSSVNIYSQILQVRHGRGGWHFSVTWHVMKELILQSQHVLPLCAYQYNMRVAMLKSYLTW